MQDALQRAWLERGLLARLLWPASRLFGALAALHRSLYALGLCRAGSAGVPVVVVGNVVAGGAGKTPVVIALAEYLQNRGIAVGVVSRGHGRRGVAVMAADPGSDPLQVGDEPLLIAQRTGVPVFVGAKRLEAALALRARHPDTQLILCDDGLQHHALQREVEICVFDDRGVGNGWLLPAGPLRERWPRRADLVLRTERAPGIHGHLLRRSLARHAMRNDGSKIPLTALQDRPCHAVAGVAQPQRFFDMLRAAGLRLQSTLALPDHHDYQGVHLPSAADGPLLCTEKDWVKLRASAPHALAVPLELEIEPAFWQALDALLLPKLSSTV